MKRKIFASVLCILMLASSSCGGDAQTSGVTDTAGEEGATQYSTQPAEQTEGEDAAHHTQPATDEVTVPAATDAPDVTTAPVTSAPETSAQETSVPDTTAPETSSPETSAPETSAPIVIQTTKPTRASFVYVKGQAGAYALVYCEVETGSLVRIRNSSGRVILTEYALGPCFYGAVYFDEGTDSLGLRISAQADGKTESGSLHMTVRRTDFAGVGVFVGKNSRLYLDHYNNFYCGEVTAPQDNLSWLEQDLRAKLVQIRQATGKNTKLIILICPNPAVVYHDLQYPEGVDSGWGDRLETTPTTQLVKLFAGDTDIVVPDLRSVMLEKRGEYIMYQTDSHWTQLGGYYAYCELMKAVKRDFPSVLTRTLSDYTLTYDWRAGDLLASSFSGGASVGMREYAPFYTSKSSPVISSDAPTAYIMGDSYLGGIDGFLTDTFYRAYYTPNPTPGYGNLYMYNLQQLSVRRPDYVVLVFTERNIGGDYGLLHQLYVE